MEPLTIFAASVGFVGIFHLMSSAVNAAGYNHPKGTTTTRGDWYCFFKMSDLLGNEWKNSAHRTTGIDTTRNAGITDQERRRQQAQRPRLHA